MDVQLALEQAMNLLDMGGDRSLAAAASNHLCISTRLFYERSVNRTEVRARGWGQSPNLSDPVGESVPRVSTLYGAETLLQAPDVTVKDASHMDVAEVHLLKCTDCTHAVTGQGSPAAATTIHRDSEFQGAVAHITRAHHGVRAGSAFHLSGRLR